MTGEAQFRDESVLPIPAKYARNFAPALTLPLSDTITTSFHREPSLHQGGNVLDHGRGEEASKGMGSKSPPSGTADAAVVVPFALPSGLGRDRSDFQVGHRIHRPKEMKEQAAVLLKPSF
jgi:hypothetical protein